MKKMILPVVVLAVFGLLFAGCADAYVADITACAKIKLDAGSMDASSGFYKIDLTDEQMALVMSKEVFYFGIDLTAKPAAGGQFRFATDAGWSPDWYFSQNSGPVEGNASFAEGDEGGRLTVDVWAALDGANIKGVPTNMSIVIGYWGSLSVDELINMEAPNIILYVKK